ncbi:MAG: CpsD/CapB family tyrosine-protein kinase [Planctomycetota bacterium]|jgi:capsular exopolysaccharide synthesis family protein
MGKMFEALRKAEKERQKLLKKAGDDPSVLTTGDGEVDPHLVTYFDRMSPISEQYRLLRTNLKGLDPDSPPKVIVVTSAVPKEGKTVTALNLALTLADDKEARVAVVDADLRKPTVHRLFAVDAQRGLADFLAGNVMLELVLQRSRLQNLHILPAGRLPANPTELLAGKKMDDLVTRLSRDFDWVVIDTPSVVSMTDAAVVGAKADGTVLAVKMGDTPRQTVRLAISLLEKARVKVLGAVLTHLTPLMQDYYYYPQG